MEYIKSILKVDPVEIDWHKLGKEVVMLKAAKEFLKGFSNEILSLNQHDRSHTLSYIKSDFDGGQFTDLQKEIWKILSEPCKLEELKNNSVEGE